jgi:HEAT repeat protein
MDPYLKVLIYFIITGSGLILIFLALIIIMRLIAFREERLYRKYEAIWEKLFIEYMLDYNQLDKIKTIFLEHKNYRRCFRFFTPYLEVLDGKDFEATKDLCREISLIGHYQQKLRSRLNYQKAEAAKFLGVLRCRKSLTERIRMLRSKNKLLVLAAAQGLAASGDLRTFRPVIKTLLGETAYSYEGITEILSRYGRNICEALTIMMDDYSRRIIDDADYHEQNNKKTKNRAYQIDSRILIIILIDLLSHYQYREALPVLQRLLFRADTETVIHILKAFIRIGSLPTRFNPTPYLEHSDWVIRNFAVQATKLTTDLYYIPALEQLLDDEQWWVRYNAAKVLLSFGEPGHQLLTKKADSSETRSAEIAAYILSSERVS